MKQLILALSLMWMLLPHDAHGQHTPREKVLFVGNSFSFYNNGIHNHLGSLIRASGEWERGRNRLRLLTLSGGHVHEHLSGLESYLTEDKRGWQAVVLQGHSNEPIAGKKKMRFADALEQAISLVKSRKLEPILFMTWAYKHEREMTSALLNAYQQQANKHGVLLVPVGLAFDEVNKRYPAIDLYVRDVLGVDATSGEITYREDIKHPSQAGTYLAACVFYASLYNKSPQGNPFTAGLEDNIARQLQAVSWQVVQAFNRKE